MSFILCILHFTNKFKTQSKLFKNCFIMPDLSNNVPCAWQLVCQFVSWEFCRYMSESDESSPSETDVFTFLRNMIVQRTKKSVSEVTKHEFIAKFIMEIKSVQSCQFPHIIPLSERVKIICPELETAVSKLIHDVGTFLNALESTDESHKELIRVRIEDAINDFSKEASRRLPQPHLLQVVESWSHHHRHHHHQLNPVNLLLFEKAKECIRFEGITPSEAKVIAVTLNNDKVFEKHLRNAEAEPETEPDSQSSQSAEHVYSQESVKNSQAGRRNGGIVLNHVSSNIAAHNQIPVQLDTLPVHVPDELPEEPDVLEVEQNEDPPHLASAVSPAPASPPVYPFLHRNISEENENVEIYNNTHNQFAQSAANESDEHNDTLQERIETRYLNSFHNQRQQSDSDTSDCEKNPEFRFLTPTYFKKGANKKNQVIYVTDHDSDDSSIITHIGNSQQDDPNWSGKGPLLFPMQYPVKRKTEAPKKMTIKQMFSSSNCNTKKKTLGENISINSIINYKKKTVRQIYSSSDSDDQPINHEANIHSRFEQQPSTSSKRTEAELERSPKRRRIAKTLYRTPNLSADDFVSIRKPVSSITSGVPVHQGTNTRSSKFC